MSALCTVRASVATQQRTFIDHRPVSKCAWPAGLSALLPVGGMAAPNPALAPDGGQPSGLAAMPVHIGGHFLLRRTSGRHLDWQVSRIPYPGTPLVEHNLSTGIWLVRRMALNPRL